MRRLGILMTVMFVGCATVETVTTNFREGAMQRASFDMGCPIEQMQITVLKVAEANPRGNLLGHRWA